MIEIFDVSRTTQSKPSPGLKRGQPRNEHKPEKGELSKFNPFPPLFFAAGVSEAEKERRKSSTKCTATEEVLQGDGLFRREKRRLSINLWNCVKIEMSEVET